MGFRIWRVWWLCAPCTWLLLKQGENPGLRFSDRFDQLVFSMTLVGRDIVGPAADKARAAELGARPKDHRRLAATNTTTRREAATGHATGRATGRATGGSRRQGEVLRSRQRRLASADDGFPTDVRSAWRVPAAANLGPLVECLESDGFQLVHREQTYDRAYDDAREVKLGVPPPKHTAAMTFVLGVVAGGGVSELI